MQWWHCDSDIEGWWYYVTTTLCDNDIVMTLWQWLCMIMKLYDEDIAQRWHYVTMTWWQHAMTTLSDNDVDNDVVMISHSDDIVPLHDDIMWHILPVLRCHSPQQWRHSDDIVPLHETLRDILFLSYVVTVLNNDVNVLCSCLLRQLARVSLNKHFCSTQLSTGLRHWWEAWHHLGRGLSRVRLWCGWPRR